MWAATLVTSGASAFGRLFLVNILPSSVLVVTLTLLVRADAFPGGRSWLTPGDVFVVRGDTTTAAVLLLLLAVALLAALTQSFEYGFVRILEGYWRPSRLALALSGYGVGRQRERFRQLQRQNLDQPQGQVPPRRPDLRLHEQRREQRDFRRRQLEGRRAAQELQQFPLEEFDLLPTRLGNAMRSFERRAGERYGYSTPVVWPRLYPHVSARIAAGFESSVDALHAGVNFTLAFALTSILSLVAFVQDPWLLWIPIVAACLALIAYRGAVAAATMQALMVAVAFDLHRFDMVAALRLEEPPNAEQENDFANHLSLFFRSNTPNSAQEYFVTRRYRRR
jgi:hypothetical protein